jgi:hypothetical protein
MMIQQNISAPCTVLDFPTREILERELATGQYDIVGISSIIVNVGKVREMCRMVRRLSPQSAIVVGGHVTALPDIEHMVDADHFVRGEGISWMRRYLGEDASAPVRHPHIVSGFEARAMGIRDPQSQSSVAATIIPSVGCPMGCNFCTTSAFFGGKGKFHNFYETGDELFGVMCEAEEALKARSFFIMDENFLLYRKRALELLERMKSGNKAWALYVFASANAIRQYSMEELAQLGISWIWMGLESPQATYVKLHGSDTLTLARELHSHGIKLLGSTIVGLEHHTPENIEEEIEHAVAHETDFHQFMLYMPMAGTPLWREMTAKGAMLDAREMPEGDMHGQHKFNYHHPGIPAGQETDLLLRAFHEDFRVNGPSLLRMVRTALHGYMKYKHHPDGRIRRRFQWEVQGFSTAYAGALWAAKRWFADNPQLVAKLDAVLREIHSEFGLFSRLVTPILGRIVLRALRKEQKRIDSGKTFEPPTFYESNFDPPVNAPNGLRKQRWTSVSN